MNLLGRYIWLYATLVLTRQYVFSLKANARSERGASITNEYMYPQRMLFFVEKSQHFNSENCLLMRTSTYVLVRNKKNNQTYHQMLLDNSGYKYPTFTLFTLQCSSAAFCLFEWEIYGPVNTVEVMSSRHYENTLIQIYGKFLFQKTENFQIKKLSYFLYFRSKHRLWVLVRTASARRF